MQLGELHSIEPELAELRVRIVAVSADSHEKLGKTVSKHELTYTLLSDFEMNASKAFGLAFHVSDDYLEKLKEYGLDTSGNAAEEKKMLPVPGVFVVGTDGLIHFTYVNPNYHVRCDSEVLLAAARAAVKEK